MRRGRELGLTFNKLRYSSGGWSVNEGQSAEGEVVLEVKGEGFRRLTAEERPS